MTDLTLFSSLVRKYQSQPRTYKEATFFMAGLGKTGHAWASGKRIEARKAEKLLAMMGMVAGRHHGLLSRYF